MQDDLRNILILFTGGTIASVKTEAGLRPVLDASQILSFLPDLGAHIALDSLQVCNLDSTNMTCEIWLKLAAAIERSYEKYDGFVICHGTDTMAYTAAALSYLIQNPDKPIVLTGSQQPIQMEITDAKKNLFDSILYAADRESCGITVIFDGRVIAGTRTKKIRSSSYQAFSSINFPELASMRHGKIVRYLPGKEKAGDQRSETIFYRKLNPRVFALKMIPGMNSGILGAVFAQYDCIVVESFGVGGIPDSVLDDFSRLMEGYEDGEKIIVMTTQVTYEGSSLSTYEVGKRIRERFSYLEAYDMNFEAAVAKMMWIMGLGRLSFPEIEALFYSKINYDVLLS